MVGSTLGHYRILAKLGEGGMGEVFRAEDTVLKRQVALKVLPFEMADNPERLARFRREAESLAALNHPGIVTIYSVETAIPEGGDSQVDLPRGQQPRDVHFLTMELVKGKSLSRLIPHGGLDLDRLFDIAIPLADAVSAAHQEGIVHRDLKPGNVMVTEDGRVKVLDFGLAKVRAAIEVRDATQTYSETLTTEGAIVGTIPYMSPEQLEGREVDSRSDIFSLGILLYQMATGERPFHGDTPVSLISSIVKDTPQEADAIRGDLPHHLSRVISHCIEKEPADRLQSALDVRNELRKLRQEIDSGQVLSSAAHGKAGSATASATRRWVAALAAVTIVALATLWLMRYRETRPLLDFAQRDWVLVSDFAYPDGEAEVAEALTLALRVGLEESGYVNVVPQTRINNLLAMMREEKEQRIDPVIGRELCLRGSIKALLAPELARVGGEYLVTLSLIAPATGDSVASFSERAEDENALLSSIDTLIDRLRQSLGESRTRLDAGTVQLEAVTTDSIEALKRYSQGRRLWYQGEHSAAVELFEEAVELDPHFASAWAALGNAYSSYVYTAPERAREAYDQALAQSDRIGDRERYFIKAAFESEFGEPDAAISAFEQYLERYPDDAAARYNLGGIYRGIGDCEQAIEQYENVLEIDPDHAGAWINTATCITRTQPQEAVSYYKQAFRIRPEWEMSGNVNYEYGLTLMMAGDSRGAQEVFEKRLAQPGASDRAGARRSLGQLAVYNGDFDLAAEHFERASLLHEGEPSSVGRDLVFWALAETARDRNRRALELLQQAHEVIPLEAAWIWLHAIVGQVHLAAGDLEGAQRISAELQRWREQNPDADADSLRRREILAAQVAGAEGEIAEALQGLEAIQEIEPADNGYLEWAIADTQFGAENWPEAVRALRSFIGLRWTFYETLVPWIRAHYRLGIALDQLGRSDEADVEYRQFLDIWGDSDSDIPEVESTRARLQRQAS